MTETSNAPAEKPNHVMATCREGTVVTHHRSEQDKDAGVQPGEANHTVAFANSGYRPLDGSSLPNVGR